MCEDLVYRAKQRGIDNPDMAEIENEALWEIELMLQQQGKSLAQYPNMPEPHRPVRASPVPEVIRRERAYNQAEQKQKAEHMLADCTSEQRAVVDKILGAMAMPAATTKCLFLYACGGCGKTFLLELLLAHVRGSGNVAAWDIP